MNPRVSYSRALPSAETRGVETEGLAACPALSCSLARGIAAPVPGGKRQGSIWLLICWLQAWLDPGTQGGPDSGGSPPPQQLPSQALLKLWQRCRAAPGFHLAWPFKPKSQNEGLLDGWGHMSLPARVTGTSRIKCSD